MVSAHNDRSAGYLFLKIITVSDRVLQILCEESNESVLTYAVESSLEI